MKIFQATLATTCKTLTNSAITPVLTNRNPRNLEKLHIGYKPSGYHLEKPGKCYWHRLELENSSKYVTAAVKHFLNGSVIQASTNEWCLKSELYRTYDGAAYYNLGKVLAERCLMFGIHEVYCDLKPNNGKLDLFLKALTDNKLTLQEPPQLKKARPWDQKSTDNELT